MTEWVVLQVLLHHRRQRAYDRLQGERRWKELPQPPAADVRVGIMGLGVLGRDAAEVLVAPRLPRRRVEPAADDRSPASRRFPERTGSTAFLARTDILVCLLPLTPETRGILAMPLFRKLARDGALGGPVLINAGRGGLQVEADIVARARRRASSAARASTSSSTEPLADGEPALGLPERRDHAACRGGERRRRRLTAEIMAPDRRVRGGQAAPRTSSTAQAFY